MGTGDADRLGEWPRHVDTERVIGKVVESLAPIALRATDSHRLGTQGVAVGDAVIAGLAICQAEDADQRCITFAGNPLRLSRRRRLTGRAVEDHRSSLQTQHIQPKGEHHSVRGRLGEVLRNAALQQGCDDDVPVDY